MIDTVKLKIPIDDVAYEEISKWCDVHIGIRKNDTAGNITKYFITKANIELGSHHREWLIRVPQQFTEHGDNHITLELSVPKYVYGHNVRMLSVADFHKAMVNINKELFEQRKISSPLEDWEILRLDICYNWKLSSEEDLDKALKIIQNLNYPRKQKFEYGTSVMFKGSAYTVKFYTKYPEFMAHDYKYFIKYNYDNLEEIMELAKRVLRFEVTIRHTHFKTVFNKSHVKVKDITEEVVLETLQNYLKKLIKLVNTEYCEDITVFEKLVAAYGEVKGRDMYEKYRLYTSENPTDQEVFYSYSYPNRYKFLKHLEKAGVGLQTEDLGYQLDLNIPSENAVY